MHQSKPRPNNKKQTSSGVVRIIGGEMRGRKIRFNSSKGLRPTLDRIRETLFNWLAQDIYGSECLDLFSGSGALGFEAASRGAKTVYFIEKAEPAVKALKDNCKLLNLENTKVVKSDAKTFLNYNENQFDIVFLDPPFGEGLLSNSFDALVPHLKPNALIYIEQEKSENEFVPPEDWQQLKYKSTGRFSYALYQRAESE